MSDRHRFRAWIPKYKLWADKVVVNDDGSHKVYGKGSLRKHFGLPDQIVELPHNVESILIQCTGLRDKNGVLIFEGDIIKKDNSTGAVIWDDGGWCVTQCRNMLFAQRGEIIGNVHEHPELVEG